MRSTFHLLETAKRSLFTHQAALNTTGHNIANANTTGYSRQVVNMEAAKPIEAVGMMRSNAPGQLGTSVEVVSITRVREKFLDDQFRNENKALGSWTVQNDTLEKLEKIVNEPSETGLRTVLDNFWKSWSDLANDPENVAGRKIVRESAVALTDAFNFTAQKLNDLSLDLTDNMKVKASEINSLTSAIANLNGEIMKIEGLGNDANDLRDQRDVLTDQLSHIVNIQVQDTAQGYTINMGTTNLVTYNSSTAVSQDSMESAYSSGVLLSGEFHGLIVSRDRFIADYIKQLDTLANSIANGEITITIPTGSVIPEGTVLNGIAYSGANRTLTGDLTVKVKGMNELHSLGYTSADPFQRAGAFFTTNNGSTTFTASNFRVNPNIITDTNQISTSLRTVGTGAAEKVVTGNNTLALLMGNLKETSFSFDGGNSASIMGKGTIDDFFRSIVGQLGVQGQEAERQVSNQKVLVEQVDNRRMSVSGVSIDEEMSDMIKFQHAYTAAARVMTTFDEMLDKVINGMGVVGR